MKEILESRFEYFWNFIAEQRMIEKFEQLCNTVPFG